MNRCTIVALVLVIALGGCTESPSGAPAQARQRAGTGTEPLYARIFFHFENIANPWLGVEDIRRQLLFLRDEAGGLPAEINIHRSELYGDFLQSQTAVWSLITDSGFQVSYHPHPTPPLTMIEVGLYDLEWDDAVASFTDLESCPVNFKQATLQCSSGETGGLLGLLDAVETAAPGRPYPIVSVQSSSSCVKLDPDDCLNPTEPDPTIPYAQLSAVKSYVYSRVFGIPTQLDSGQGSLHELMGSTPLYWYMGMLIFSHPEGSEILQWALPGEVEAVIDGFDRSQKNLVSILGKDKALAASAHTYIDEHYEQGVTSRFDLYPPACARHADGTCNEQPDCWCEEACKCLTYTREGECVSSKAPASETLGDPDTCWDEYFRRFESAVGSVGAVANTQFVKTTRFLDLVQSPDVDRSASVIYQAAGKLRAEVDSSGHPPLEIRAGQKYLSLTDLYALTLSSLHEVYLGNPLPAKAGTSKLLLGPIGDPVTCASSVGTATIPATSLLGHVKLSSVGGRVPYEIQIEAQLPPIGNTPRTEEVTLRATEILYLLAETYQRVSDGEALSAISLQRPATEPCLVPAPISMGIGDAFLLRWHWYSFLQHWTVKRAQW